MTDEIDGPDAKEWAPRGNSFTLESTELDDLRRALIRVYGVTFVELVETAERSLSFMPGRGGESVGMKVGHIRSKLGDVARELAALPLETQREWLCGLDDERTEMDQAVRFENASSDATLTVRRGGVDTVLAPGEKEDQND